MGFADAIARQQEAIFRALGADATWSGVSSTVRVVRRVADEDLQLGRGVIVETGCTIRVRKSEVPSPAERDQVQLLDDVGAPVEGGLHVINGTPQIDRKGVWHCPATAGN